MRKGGILAKLWRSDGRGSANFRVLCASRLISVAADCSTLRSIINTAIIDLPFNTYIQLAYNKWKAVNSKAKGSLSVIKAA